jgi:Tfp pilus assembly protein PilF
MAGAIDRAILTGAAQLPVLNCMMAGGACGTTVPAASKKLRGSDSSFVSIHVVRRIRAVMATRVASPSLRGRFKWIVACAVAIALVSWVGILIYRSAGRTAEEQVANAGSASAPADEKHSTPPASNAETQTSAGSDFSSPYGYKVAFAGTEWARSDDLAAVVPAAEFGALFKHVGRFLIIPVPLGNLDPRDESLDHALLACLGIAYPSDQISGVDQIETSSVAGHRFQVRREVNGNAVDYRICIFRRGDFAYLAAAWADHAAAASAGNESGKDLAFLDDALGRITFEAPSNTESKVAALTAARRQAIGNIYNDLGSSAYNARDFGAAIESFRQAFQLQPNDPTILTNLINARIELKQFREALAELDLTADRFANQPDLLAARAFLLSELGDTEPALRAYKTLFAKGFFAEPPFTQYVSLLAESGRTDEALSAVTSALQARDSVAIRRLEAGLLRQKGAHQEAANVLLPLLNPNRPFSAEIAYDLADCLWACDRYEESLEVCRQLLAHRYDTAHTYLLQAKSEHGLQWYAEARKSLNAALKREPANKDAQDLLAVVTAALGEGNNSAVQDFIEPVARAQAPSQDAATVESPNPIAHDGAFYFDRSLAISFVPSKEFKQTERRTIRIQDASGVVRFTTLQVAFDPVAEQLFVNNLRVLDPSGKVIGVGKPSEYYIIDAARSDAAVQTKILNIPVPGLQPECVIELEFTRRAAVPPASFPYLAHYFSAGLPVRNASLFVRTDPDAVKFENSPEVRFERTSEGLLWTIDNPAIQQTEALPAPRSTYLPHVVIASPNVTWKQLASEYLDSIHDRLTPEAAVEALAKECTTDAKDVETKTIAIIRTVQDRLTYKAVEFGRRARVPSRAAEIAQNKFGDCKDHALLLVQMLRACNIPAELALANLDETVDPGFASFEQFNHMLVYLPNFRGGRVIDCTDKDGDLASLTAPTDLGGAQVLVLDEKNPRFIQLPTYPDDSSSIEVSRTVKVSGDSDAAVEERVTVAGYHAAFLRNMFKGVAAAERPAVLQRELAPLGISMQVQSIDIDNLADREKPLIFRASYLVRGRFRSADSILLGELPALWERMYLDVPPVANRRTPFDVEYPLDFTSTITFVAPRGFAIQPPKEANAAAQSAYANWKLHAEPTSDSLRFDYSLHLPAGHHPAGEYAAYDEAMENAVAGLAQNVVLKSRQ